jgi:hypothetical protein
VPAATAAFVLQENAVLLDLEEFLVERDELGTLEFALRGELLLGVSEDFFAMSEEMGSQDREGSPARPQTQVWRWSRFFQAIVVRATFPADLASLEFHLGLSCRHLPGVELRSGSLDLFSTAEFLYEALYQHRPGDSISLISRALFLSAGSFPMFNETASIASARFPNRPSRKDHLELLIARPAGTPTE